MNLAIYSPHSGRIETEKASGIPGLFTVFFNHADMAGLYLVIPKSGLKLIEWKTLHE